MKSTQTGMFGGGGLTRPILRDEGTDQLGRVPIIGQLPGTRPEVHNGEGVVEDGQT